jgi:hypothetical protein
MPRLQDPAGGFHRHCRLNGSGTTCLSHFDWNPPPFACRTTQEAHDLFYQIARAKDWSCGTTFEKALEALHEKLAR